MIILGDNKIKMRVLKINPHERQ
jgi:hypothetical protein